MKTKIVTLLAASILSLSVNASVNPLNTQSILIDSLSTPNVTVVKDADSINLNKKVEFNIKIYSEEVENVDDANKAQNIEHFSKDSSFITSLSDNKYNLEQVIKIKGYEGVSSIYSNMSNIPINKSIELTSKKDGNIKTQFTSDYIKVGRSVTIEKKSDMMSIQVSEVNIEKWRKYKSEFGVIDLPMLYQWNTNQKIKVETDKSIIIKSPVYKDNGKYFRTIYLIDSTEIK